MTFFYGLPNDGHFWHWPTLIHFVLVALAAGAVFLVGVAAVRGKPPKRWMAILAFALIALDLFVLWAESPARFRLTHINLFLGIHPSSPIWWGAWSLAGSAVLTALVALRWGPQQWIGAALVATSSVALLYPGAALAVNVNRPLWTPVLFVLIPITSLLLTLGLALFLRLPALKPWVAGLGVGSAGVAGIYLLALRVGDAEAREAFTHLWHDAGAMVIGSIVLMAAAAPFAKRMPWLAGIVAAAGAILLRSLIVDVGQYQPFAF